MILTDGLSCDDPVIGAPPPAADVVSHVLLVERDANEARFVQSALARTRRTDLMVWHEPSLSRGLTLLGLCQFRVILLGASLPELTLHAAVHAISQVAPGTPVVVMRDRGGERDSAELLAAVGSLLGN